MEFPITQERLVELLEEQDVVDVQVLPKYSGRGMYGRECVAFTASDQRTVTQLWILLAANSEAEGYSAEDLMDIVYKEQRDSGGHEMIVYYPDVTFPAAEHDCHNSRTNCTGTGCPNDDSEEYHDERNGTIGAPDNL